MLWCLSRSSILISQLSLLIKANKMISRLFHWTSMEQDKLSSVLQRWHQILEIHEINPEIFDSTLSIVYLVLGLRKSFTGKSKTPLCWSFLFLHLYFYAFLIPVFYFNERCSFSPLSMSKNMAWDLGGICRTIYELLPNFHLIHINININKDARPNNLLVPPLMWFQKSQKIMDSERIIVVSISEFANLT